MAQKSIHVRDIGEVFMQKRRGNRSMRLSIAHDGKIRLSMPPWTPYRMGEAFVISKTKWLREQMVQRQVRPLEAGTRIGKAHHINIIHEARGKIVSRVSNTEITIRLPFEHQVGTKEAQAVIQAACVRALKKEAKDLLPIRLKELAQQSGYSYRSVSIKQLRSRWGSCSSQKDIVLNCFLMQLPWQLIDYVLLHELVHTKVMAHGPVFWDELKQHVNDLPHCRRLIRSYQPSLIPIKSP